MNYKALVTAPPILPKIFNYKEIFDQKSVEIIVPPYKVIESLSENQLSELIINVDGILCGDDEINLNVLKKAKKLKVISKWGTGIDSIDKKSATSMGIKVSNVNNVFADPVSETVLSYILLHCRKILEKDRLVKNDKWEKVDSYTLKEKSLGVIGAGHIGSALVEKASKLGMKVFINDIKPVSSNLQKLQNIELVDFNFLIKNSDFISLHCDLNTSSFHLISYNEMKIMKPNAVIINTCRGEVIDQKALERALKEKIISGACLDVFEKEPLPKKSNLRNYENVLLSPHNSNGSPYVYDKVDKLSIENLFDGMGI